MKRAEAALADLPEVAAFKRRRKRLLFAVAALVLIALVAGRPVYAAFKQWRCRDLAARSSALLAEGRVDEALGAARSAHQLVPTEPAALRAVGRVLVARNDYLNAMAFFSRAVECSGSSADRLELGECALRAGAMKQAEAELVRLLADAESSASTHLFAARLYAARRDPVSAIAAAGRAVELATEREADLLLGQLLIRDEKMRSEGFAILTALSAERSSAGLGALLQLALVPDQDSPALLKIAGELRAHPLAGQPEHMKALELELRALPEEKMARLDKEEARCRDASLAELRQFATWLVAQGEPARALRLLPVERARSRKDLFVARMDAMAAMGQWPDILKLLENSAPLEPALIHLYRARCWKELSDAAKSDAAWRLALASAAGDAGMALYLAGYAEKVGAIEHARRAYRLVANNPQSSRYAFDNLLRLTPRTDSAALRGLLAEMARKWPHDSAIANDLAYLNILMGQQVGESRRRARDLVAAAPESLPHRTVLALAELREGDPQAALRVYQGLRIDWRMVAPGAAAVYASVLRHAGRTAEAMDVAARLEKEHLRPEERELLAEIATP